MARGRPAFDPTDKQRLQVEAMVRYGISQDEIAKTLGISKSSLIRHFRAEIETGTTKANAQVEVIYSTSSGSRSPGAPR